MNAIVSLLQNSSMTKHVMLSSQNLLGLNQPQKSMGKHLQSHTHHLASISREEIITHTHMYTHTQCPLTQFACAQAVICAEEHTVSANSHLMEMT